MTTIATGGFSNYNQSIGFFESAKIEYVSIVFIILGSIPFISYIKFLSGNKKIIFKDEQIRLFFKLIVFSIYSRKYLSSCLFIKGTKKIIQKKTVGQDIINLFNHSEKKFTTSGFIIIFQINNRSRVYYF